MRHEPTLGVESITPASAEILASALRTMGVKVDMPEVENIQSGAELHGFEELTAEEERNFRVLIERAQLYLKAPLIVDSYENDHDARREWETRMAAEHGVAFRDFLDSNKLGTKMITVFANRYILLMETLRKRDLHSPKLLKLKELYTEVPSSEINKYGTLTQARKIEIAGILTDVAYSILELARSR